MTRTTSPAGCVAIRQREGCRTVAYRDSVGVPTIGTGHTGRAAPPPVHMGMRITQAQADAFLAADLRPTEAAINAAVTRPTGVNQFDAFASLAFNIGGHGFATSSVVRRFNAGDIAGAANAFLMWCKPKELLGRRKAERLQFLRPDAPPRTLPRLAPPPPPVAAPQPPAAQPPKAPTMKAKSVPFLAGLLLAVFGASAANAAEIDFQPLVSAGLEYVVVPLLGSLATWLVGMIGVGAKKYLDQKTASLLAQNVDGVLNRAISYAAAQAATYIGREDFHLNVDGWIASYAATYANSHAPQLMKQAGDVTQKIVARLAEHPDVLLLKHKAENDNAPQDIRPAAQAAAA